MRRVVLESPYAGDIDRNVAYARRAVRHSLRLGEAPIASHLLYPQPYILREEDVIERQWGIDAGHAWLGVCDLVVFYVDLGWSNGMGAALDRCADLGVRHTSRLIGERESSW